MTLYYDSSPVGTTYPEGSPMNNSLLLALAFAFISRRDTRHDRRRLIRDLETYLATVTQPPIGPVAGAAGLLTPTQYQTAVDLVAVESRDTARDRGGELLPMLALLGSGQTSAAVPATTTTTPAPTTTPTQGIDPQTLFLIAMMLSQNSW
jgi:hypothetical protein